MPYYPSPSITSIPLLSLFLSVEWLKLRSALTTIPVSQPMTSNPQSKPYRIISVITKIPEIRHFSFFIYLFLTANRPSPHAYQMRTYPHKIISVMLYALPCHKILIISNSTNSMPLDIVLKNQLNIVAYQHNLPKPIIY